MQYLPMSSEIDQIHWPWNSIFHCLIIIIIIVVIVYNPPQNYKWCPNLLTIMLFQTCISSFLMLNTKEDILKNAESNSCWPPFTS